MNTISNLKSQISSSALAFMFAALLTASARAEDTPALAPVAPAPATPAHAPASPTTPSPLVTPPLTPTPTSINSAAASSSIMARSVQVNPLIVDAQGRPVTASMFAVAPPKPREFEAHDLVTIIVRETSTTQRKHELTADKDFGMDGSISAFPDLQLADLLNFQLNPSSIDAAPALDMTFAKEFKGKGDYKRSDNLTDRLTAEVIEVLPNGNLVLEARTRIKTDDEVSVMKVTGICRGEDVTAANTLLSTQIHDLVIERDNAGELKKSNEKGIIAKFFEALFAF